MNAGWKTVKLNEIALIGAGNSAPQETDDFSEDGPLFVRTSDVGEVKFGTVVSARDRLSSRGAKGMRLWKSGTILIPKSGASTFVNHRVILGTDAHVSSHLATIAADATKTDPRFLLYYLSTVRAQDLIQDQSYPSLKLPEIGSIEISLPPLAEQKRIVALLDEAFAGIDEAIANAKQKLSDAQSITDSHIHSIFTKHGPGWAKNVLCELCTFSSGNTPSKSNSGYWNGTIPWISGRDMKSTRLSDSHLHISKSAVEEYGTRVAEPGTLLVLVRGMGLAHGAQVAELTAPCAFNQDIRGIHANTGILPRYLLFALKHGINNGDSVLSSAAHGTLKIDSNELHSLPISYPDLKQQERIVVSIDALTAGSQSLAKNLGKQVAAFDELRKALLTQAFAGELTA
jgi:type I restriction enzyme S subunit